MKVNSDNFGPVFIFAVTLLLTGYAFADDLLETEKNEASLAEYIQNDNSNAAENVKKDNGTWLSNAVESLTSGKSDSERKKKAEQKSVKRSNASVFDISGIMLRMDLPQVEDAMDKRGYKKVAVQMEIPNFIRWRYDEQCRNKGVTGYERAASCVNQLAKKNNYRYVQHISFGNFHTKENVDVFFTSNFTGNKVYRVMYQTEAANIKGVGPKAEYLRNLKIFDFWKKINQKYGAPDNPDSVTWGLGENKPSLQADTGRLVLFDPMLLELDYTRMAREDQKFMNTAIYTF